MHRQTLRTTLDLIAKKMEEAAEEISCIPQVLVCVCVRACLRLSKSVTLVQLRTLLAFVLSFAEIILIISGTLKGILTVLGL